ncbi:hypothetical protein ANN_24809 [Periplaneta americana]|uniref:MULE transposase domain-containing protein n=1 Tax=Periplaneta americana TaxID=6978 RepID=A0ABQ8RZU6_PERAM|nr:hypothetical protein ANN_24809 [Periplaneta americana]
MCILIAILLLTKTNSTISIFKGIFQGSGDLPTFSRLRNEYMPRYGTAIHNDINMALEGKPIIVVADETSDKEGRCVFAILFRTIVQDRYVTGWLPSDTYKILKRVSNEESKKTITVKFIVCMKRCQVKLSNHMNMVPNETNTYDFPSSK